MGPQGWFARHQGSGWYVAGVVAAGFVVQWAAEEGTRWANLSRVLILTAFAVVVAVGSQVIYSRWRRTGNLLTLPMWVVTLGLMGESVIVHIQRWSAPPNFQLGYNAGVAIFAVWAVTQLHRYERLEADATARRSASPRSASARDASRRPPSGPPGGDARPPA